MNMNDAHAHAALPEERGGGHKETNTQPPLLALHQTITQTHPRRNGRGSEKVEF